MEKRMEDISLLGFGTMRLPVLNNDDSKVDIEKSIEMFDYALKSGVNYFDTAYGYHGQNSERAVKEALVKRHDRDSFYLADKMPLWCVKEKSDLEKVFNEQLEKTGVDYFDFYLLHAMAKERHILAKNIGAYEFIKNLKAEGKAKHIGFSFHDTPDVLEEIILECPEFEFVQLQINYQDWDDIEASELYRIARKYNKKIIVMEPVKGGSLSRFKPEIESILTDLNKDASISSWAMRFCGSLDGVICVLSGMSNLDQVKDNIKTMVDFKPLNDDEMTAIDKVISELKKQSMVSCTGCRYCYECPKSIAIPEIFQIYNTLKMSGDKNKAKEMYLTISEDNRANKCIECGKCEKHCPQNLKIIKELKKSHQALNI